MPKYSKHYVLRLRLNLLSLHARRSNCKIGKILLTSSSFMLHVLEELLNVVRDRKFAKMLSTRCLSYIVNVALTS